MPGMTAGSSALASGPAGRVEFGLLRDNSSGALGAAGASSGALGVVVPNGRGAPDRIGIGGRVESVRALGRSDGRRPVGDRCDAGVHGVRSLDRPLRSRRLGDRGGALAAIEPEFDVFLEIASIDLPAGAAGSAIPRWRRWRCATGFPAGRCARPKRPNRPRPGPSGCRRAAGWIARRASAAPSARRQTRRRKPLTRRQSPSRQPQQSPARKRLKSNFSPYTTAVRAPPDAVNAP